MKRKKIILDNWTCSCGNQSKDVEEKVCNVCGKKREND